MGGDVGHVELDQRRLGGSRVVVGGAADQREAGERDHRVDGRAAVVEEEALDGGARIEAAGKGRNDGEAARLEGGDDAVIVAGVAGEQVGAQDDEPDAGAAAGRQARGGLGDPLRQPRVVEADIGIVDRRRRGDLAAQALARAVGIAVDEQADHVLDVVVGSGEPVLQHEEIGAQVLGRAGDEAQDLRQAPQHPHLAGARSAAGARLAAQALQEGQRAARLLAETVAAKAREVDDVGDRHAADDGVAGLATGAQVVDDRRDMLLHEQHGAEDDVGVVDGAAAAGESPLVARPFGGGVQRQVQSRQARRHAHPRSRDNTRQVVVQRDDGDADRRRVSGRNELSHRRGCPG